MMTRTKESLKKIRRKVTLEGELTCTKKGLAISIKLGLRGGLPVVD